MPDDRRSALTPLRVSILAVPETSATAVYGLYEMLSSVGVLWQQVTGEAVSARRIEARIVARSRRPYRSAIGTPIAPHASLAEQGLADVVVVTDISLPLALEAPSRWTAEMRWVREHLEAGAQVCSACTGRSCWQRPACWTGATRPRTGALRRCFAIAIPWCAGIPNASCATVVSMAGC